MQFPILQVIAELSEEREFLINQLPHTFEKDELLMLSGRIYELNKVIKKFEEM